MRVGEPRAATEREGGQIREQVRILRGKDRMARERLHLAIRA
jgi:hypothetical protein